MCGKVVVRLVGLTFLVSALVAGGALVGCSSAEAGELDPVALGDQAITDEYASYAAFAARHGLGPRTNRALVIGVRGRDLAGNMHDTRVRREYDDTLVVLTADRRIVKLAASTHPWETEGGADVPDVDRDGRPDVGMIRPGQYVAVRRDASRDIAGARTYQVTVPSGSDRLPGWRNTDHDDAYSPDERSASEARGDTLTAVLFHQGGDGAPKAVGCQVLDASGIRRLTAEAGARFDYLLVDADDEEVP